MNKQKIRQMVGISILSAIIVVLQSLGSFIKLGPMVSVSLVQIPIVVGAALYGPSAGACLGGVFGLVVLFQPDTAFFYGINFFGTVLTVMVKGIMEGYLSGLTYRALSGKNQWVAVGLAAAVAPLVNTGLFSLGSRLFFWEAFAEMGNGDAMMILLSVMIGFNFIAEFIVNVVCAPVIVRILHAVRKN